MSGLRSHPGMLGSSELAHEEPNRMSDTVVTPQLMSSFDTQQ